jgi:transposase
VARGALREPDLPKACLDGPSRDIKLLVDHRRTLVAQRTAIGNKLGWFLHELDPELAVASRGLRRLCILDHLAHALIQHHGTLAAIAAELVADCRRLSERINALESQIRRLVTARAPHLARPSRSQTQCRCYGRA